MTERPFILSLLIGLIVVLVIAGVSLLVKMNALDETYKKEIAQNIGLQKKVASLEEQNNSLEGKNTLLATEIIQLKTQAETLQVEITKLGKLKEKLEESLSEELMKEKATSGE